MADPRADAIRALEDRLARQVPALAERAVVGFDPAAIARDVAITHPRRAPLFRALSPAWVLLMLALLLAALAGAIVVGSGLLRPPVPAVPVVYHHNGEITLITGGSATYSIDPSSGAHTVINTGVYASNESAEWSPDGSRLAIIATKRLYIYSRATGTSAEVPLSLPVSSPVGWSPDGARVAYLASDGIHLVDLASGHDSLLTGTAPPQVDPSWLVPGRPTWSSNGQQVLYTVEGPSAGRAYVAGVDGSGAHLVAVARGGFNLAWSPDGSKIAYLLDPQQNPPPAQGDPNVVQLWVANADGSQPTKLFERPGCCIAASVEGPSWSPDGKRIELYVFELWVVDSRAGGAVNLGSVPAGATHGPGLNGGGQGLNGGWLAWRPVP